MARFRQSAPVIPHDVAMTWRSASEKPVNSECLMRYCACLCALAGDVIAHVVQQRGAESSVR